LAGISQIDHVLSSAALPLSPAPRTDAAAIGPSRKDYPPRSGNPLTAARGITGRRRGGPDRERARTDSAPALPSICRGMKGPRSTAQSAEGDSPSPTLRDTLN